MLRLLRFHTAGRQDPLLQKAVEALRERGVEVVWSDGCEEGEGKGCVYVLDNFDRPCYKSLLDKRRLVGPAVVLAHLSNGWPLPVSMQPVFSQAMRGVVACFTQAGSRERRESLTSRVKLMGGRVEGDFTKRVTHLIAGQVGSTKYHVARRLSLPVMLPSWVEQCWERGLSGVLYATQEELLSGHCCLPFTGCTIAVTGLNEKARGRVKQLCLENGGSYSGELTKDVCTHLLVGSKSGMKYHYARQWKMFCVTPQWFHDSVDSGYCLPEGDYDCEGGDGVRGKRGKEEEEEERGWVKELEEFQIPMSADNDFLASCRIYFCGFTEGQLEKLYRLVNLGAGTRYSNLGDHISHVVMGTKDPQDLRAIQQLEPRPHVVGVAWLLQSCSRGQRSPEDGHLRLSASEHLPPPPSTAAAARKRKLSEDVVQAAAKRVCGGEGGEEEEEDLLTQYRTAELPQAPPPSTVRGEGVLGGREVSISTLFPTSDRQIASDVVWQHGGVVVATGGSYHLMPLQVDEVGGARKEDHTHMVTMVWLQRCIEADTLLDPASYFLFEPLTTPISGSTLVECVLAFSQFSDVEREHLVRFSRGLGATVQDHFARYPGHGLQATTHLVLKYTNGEKLSFALKWGVPAVADSWLFACATAQSIVPVEPHLMTSAEADTLQQAGSSTAGSTTLSKQTKTTQEQQQQQHLLQEDKQTTVAHNEDLDANTHKAEEPPTKQTGTSEKRGEPEEEEEEEEEGGAKSMAASEVARRLQQQLEEMKGDNQRRKRRTKRDGPAADLPPPPPPVSQRSPVAKARPRRGRKMKRREEPLTDSQVSDSQLLQVTYDDPEGRRAKAELLARIQRDEEMRAQGLDPKQFREASSSNQADIKLILPPLRDTTTSKRTSENGKKQELPSSKAPTRRVEQPNDGGDPLSAPSLNVPIVTHASRRTEVEQLFDDSRPRLRRSTPPKFLLSSLEQREKLDYGALIQDLGGEYIDQDYFSTKCTHIVVGKASRTEKYLGACAAGKWVLHKSFLEACRAENKFVEEEPHEWGGGSVSGDIQPLETAPRRWRLALATQSPTGGGSAAAVGAFSGWKVLLFAEKTKLAGLRRLLEAGGATVLTKVSPSAVKDLTHAFITMSHFPNDQVTLRELVDHGVHCLKPDYIAEFLSKGSEVAMDTLVINEARALMQR